ncbi:hypothetical protein AVEN_27594-1, partial [Araneus ventricosus]
LVKTGHNWLQVKTGHNWCDVKRKVGYSTSAISITPFGLAGHKSGGSGYVQVCMGIWGAWLEIGEGGELEIEVTGNG